MSVLFPNTVQAYAPCVRCGRQQTPGGSVCRSCRDEDTKNSRRWMSMSDTNIRCKRLAVNILRSMAKLLLRRKKLEIDRKTFLARWRVLRRELNATPEYRKVRAFVRERDAGICQRCGEPGSIGAHKRGVSIAPQHALDPKNWELVCEACHADEHPWLRR